MDKKCAPGIKYEKGSCITKEVLQAIAINFNKEVGSVVIDPNVKKEQLVKQLDNEFNNKFKCDDQLCWLNQRFVKRLNNEVLEKFTFKPTGPANKYDWLSTTNINNVIEQYERKYKNFIFLGAVPYDFQELRQLEMAEINFKDLQNGKLNDKHNTEGTIDHIGMVINLDPHNKPGSHWVSLYANLDKNQMYFFDSFGKKPRKKIKTFINKITKYMYQKKYNKQLPINKVLKNIKNNNNIQEIDNLNTFDIRYNQIQHQFEDTECGVYSINFIIRLVGGETFDDITNNIKNDDFMNNCRKSYFQN
jgi:hypothetical protein